MRLSAPRTLPHILRIEGGDKRGVWQAAWLCAGMCLRVRYGTRMAGFGGAQAALLLAALAAPALALAGLFLARAGDGRTRAPRAQRSRAARRWERDTRAEERGGMLKAGMRVTLRAFSRRATTQASRRIFFPWDFGIRCTRRTC